MKTTLWMLLWITPLALGQVFSRQDFRWQDEAPGLQGPDYGAMQDPLGAQRQERPLRHISIIVTDQGFVPNRVSVFSGERVRFFVTGSGTKPHCLTLDDPGLFLAANRGSITEGQVVFQEVGRKIFHCPTLGRRDDPRQGVVTVLPKPLPAEAHKERAPASTHRRVSGQWRPRDFPESTEQVLREY